MQEKILHMNITRWSIPKSDWFFLCSQRWRRSIKVKLFSPVWLFVIRWTVAHQAPLSMGFSKKEYWSGLPFPSPMHESEKWNWSRSVVPDSWRPHGLQPTRLLRPWDFPGKSTGVGCHCLLRCSSEFSPNKLLHWLCVLNVNASFTALGSSLNTPNAWFLMIWLLHPCFVQMTKPYSSFRTWLGSTPTRKSLMIQNGLTAFPGHSDRFSRIALRHFIYFF